MPGLHWQHAVDPLVCEGVKTLCKPARFRWLCGLVDVLNTRNTRFGWRLKLCIKPNRYSPLLGTIFILNQLVKHH
jgi:hypothetical protein